MKVKAGIKKTLRILLFVAMTILLLLLGIYAVLQTSSVQTILVKYITERIKETTGVQIQIGSVDFRPISSLILHDVLLQNFKNDTIVFCENLQVKTDSLNVIERSFKISEIVLDKASIHLWMEDTTRKTNFESLIASLIQQKEPKRVKNIDDTLTQKKKNWLVGIEKITLQNSRFTYREFLVKPIDYGVNWTDIDCRELNLVVTGINFAETPIQLEIEHLSVVEKSGLVLKNLSGKVQATSSNLQVTGAYFELAKSYVNLTKLEYNWMPNQHAWRYFLTHMQQYYEVGYSSVSFIDLAYFNGILRGIDNTVKCSGIVSNTIEHLEGENLYIELGEESVFQGSFKSHGLPDVLNSTFNIDIKNAHLSPEDLAAVYLPWFDMNIPIPDPLYKLPHIDFKQINFDGKLDDFVVEAQSTTPALKGDFNLIYKPAKDTVNKCVSMQGDFKFNRLNFNLFTGNSMLGRGVLSGSYNGIWDDNGESFNISSKLHRLQINKGCIRDADIAMTWENNHLDLLASVDDKNLSGGFLVTYDMNDSLNFASAKGHLQFHDLSALGLNIKDSTETLTTSFDLLNIGDDNKNFSKLNITDLHYSNAIGSFQIADLALEDAYYDKLRSITLKSDILDAFIDGNFQEDQARLFIWGLIHNYLPVYSKNKKLQALSSEELKGLDFKYDIHIKDADDILDVLYPSLSLSPGAKLSSHFQGKDESLDLTFLADTIQYNNISLLNSKIEMAGNMDTLKLYCTASQLGYGLDYQLYNVRNEINLTNNTLFNQLNWCNWEAETYSGELATRIKFIPDSKNKYRTDIQIYPGTIIVQDSVWKVSPSSVTIEGKEVDIQGFSVFRGDEYLSVEGRISEGQQEKLFVNLKNFDLKNLAEIEPLCDFSIFGVATGSLSVQDYYKELLFLSNFNIKNIGIKKDTLGDLRFRSYWDATDQNLRIAAENQVGDKFPLRINGVYSPETDSIHVNIKLEQVDLQRLAVYAPDVVSDVKGSISGDILINGASKEPDVSGLIYLDSVGVKVNKLNTPFFVNDTLKISRNKLKFDDLSLKDINNQTAILDGEYHIWNNRYKVQAKFKDMLVLNTGFSENESFYGQMYLSGLAELNNTDGITNVTINVRTEENSRLYVPLTNSVDETSNNFLHFMTNNQAEKSAIEPQSSVLDINLNANIEVNDHLDIQAIFDPTVGDVLRARGSGNIKISFDKNKDLSMLGSYQISKGDYLFTLSNLVNKKFILTPGGTIDWSGSPYDAILNLNAVYHLKTTIAELLPDASEGDDIPSEAGRKVPVECILNLSENLTNPRVKFDINFPSLETQSRSYIQSLFSSQDEVNKQMFSLLVLNSFYRADDTRDYGQQAQTAGVSTLTEMLSNQLSRWFSQFSNNVDIGFAYRVGNFEDNMTSDELELAVSTQLLNNRITISANGNMDVGQDQNATTDSRGGNIAGDFDVEVKLNRQGTLKMKAYSHMDEKLLYNNTETIQGIGVSYQESFNTFNDLLHKYFGFLSRKKN